jgi:hypothetical protein
MVLAKSKNAVGLGNSLMNDRFGKGKRSEMHRGNAQAGIQRTNQMGETVSRLGQMYAKITNSFLVYHKREERGIMGQNALRHRASRTR